MSRPGANHFHVPAIACAALLLLALPRPVVAQTPLGFETALTMVRERNERWQAADVSVSRAREVRAEQRGLYWPKLGVSGIYAHLNDRLFVDLSSLRTLLQALNPAVPVPPLSATVLENDPAKVSLSASWTLFTGGRISSANRAAQASLKATDQERRGTQQDLTTELVDRYFRLRLAAEVRGVRQQALETLERHVADARRLQDAGQIARTDALRAEVARAEADRDYKKAVRDVSLATAALQATLGTEQEVIPATPLPPSAELGSLEEFLLRADSSNPDLGRLDALREQSHQGTRAAKAQYFPQLQAFGRRELIEHRLNSTTDPQWIVGVVLQWDLFDGFGREHKVEAAQLSEQELALRRQGAGRDVRTLVQNRYNDYQSALEQYTALQSALDLATESLRSEQRAFAEGVGTSLSVVDAELSLSRIQVGRLTALYDMILALARLLDASGQSDRILEYIP